MMIDEDTLVKNWRFLAVSVILVLALSVCPGVASAAPIDDGAAWVSSNSKPANSVKTLRDCLNRQDPVTITLGGLPTSKGGQNASYSDLKGFRTATWDLIREHYLYPNGSLIDLGYDIDGYLRVSIWNGPPPPENISSIEAVYAMLDEQARNMGIEHIPVKFTVFVSPPKLILDCSRPDPDQAGPSAQPSAEINSLDALTVALHDPEVIRRLENECIESIMFSRGTYQDGDINYTRMVFRLKDRDPDDCMTALVVVQVNDSYMVSAAYTTYPAYIPNCTPADHQQNVSIS